MATVEFRNLIKKYGELQVVHGIDLTISDGEFIVLVGPSGCGKSTSLRMLAGLEDITSGEILIGDKTVNEIAPRNRDIAMVFQDYALYPHMSVYDNMAFSLRYRDTPKSQIKQRVAEAAEILDLTALLDRRPKQLSGGQRQRVAMGRAIVRKPQVFLFDEPLSNLDAKLRGSMRLEIKKLHRELGVTTVYVTHDQIEAMTLADRVVVMNGGNIDQIGAPEDVYNSPLTLFVAGFIGSPTMNLIPVSRNDDGSLRVDGEDGFTLSHPAATGATGSKYVFGVRPEDIRVANGSDTPASVAVDGVAVDGVVDVVEALGPDTLVFANVGRQPVTARIRPDIRVRPGDAVRLEIDVARSHLFDAATGKALR
tara:strand:+ start:4758 stop:5855 length:1098 start_codon:yes stop_codon:yes gene_type:complete